ncbi:MAG TPA: histidine--tRNA ligase [Bacteroidales bacterium]|nr:histidine--tRNA ligase [Bacteroidales bacterium]
MAQKPSIPKGTRDFTPDEMRKRNFIFDTLKSVFQLYGFQQIETPAMENLSTLLGKYGEEGDKLLFRILNSGDFLSDVTDEKYKERNLPQLSALMCEKGLRYDLTVPFARFVVQNRESIQFPFKRYQIQPVWRADRPQKGRYREFYQCDVDVVGSDSLLNEVELIQIIDKGFKQLGVRTLIKMNNRKILSGIAEIIGQPDKITDITVAIDKLEKIGIDKVKDELRERGVTEDAIIKLQPVFELSGSNEDKLMKLKNWIASSEIGLKGIDELQTVFTLVKSLAIETPIELDLTLARGLNYYTGAIFEVKARDVEIGSICGGGRYDNLTGIFGLPGVSGVGISFGADRIFDVLNQLNCYPADASQGTQILFTNFGEKEASYCLPLLQKLRNEGIKAELYPDNAKMKKQMGYADAKKIPFVAMVGEDEMSSATISLKNMQTGEQTKVSFNELLGKLR